MSLFDVIGPIMIGPSSSHTAGAAKIGLLARRIYHRSISKVSIILYNSFADTGPGHGTMHALAGGLLGLAMDDEKIPLSLEIAKNLGVEFVFHFREDPEKHPNYVTLEFWEENEISQTISGISIGGGHARIIEIDGNKVEFSGRHDMLIMTYKDICGMVALVGELLARHQINIAYMQISRDANQEKALAVLKLDASVPDNVIETLRKNEAVFSVVAIPRWKETLDESS